MRCVSSVFLKGRADELLQETKPTDGLDNFVILQFKNFSEMREVLAALDIDIAVLEAEAGVFSVPSNLLTNDCVVRPILGGVPAENLAASIGTENWTGLGVGPDNIDGFLKADVRLRNELQL